MEDPEVLASEDLGPFMAQRVKDAARYRWESATEIGSDVYRRARRKVAHTSP